MIITENNQLVSIITPAWKAARLIEETISSVRAQTYSNWELLVVDDCSPDDTCEIVESAIAGDNRIQLIRQPQNGGPAKARNAGLERARGRWIAFLDSDDLWLPKKLEHQLSFQKSQNAKITFTQYRRISDDGEKTGHLIKIPSKLNYNQLLSNTAIATSTVLVDRLLSGPFKMKSIYYDDFGCWLDILRENGVAVGLEEDLMRYRVMQGSVSRNKWRSANEVWKTYRKVENLNLSRSCWHFCQYAFNALLKYREF